MTQPNAKNIDELLNELQAVAESSKRFHLPASMYLSKELKAFNEMKESYPRLILALRHIKQDRDAMLSDFYDGAVPLWEIEDRNKQEIEILQGKGGG